MKIEKKGIGIIKLETVHQELNKMSGTIIFQIKIEHCKSFISDEDIRYNKQKNLYYIQMSEYSEVTKFILQKLNKKISDIQISISKEQYEELISTISELKKKRDDYLNETAEKVVNGEILVSTYIAGCDYEHYVPEISGFKYENSQEILRRATENICKKYATTEFNINIDINKKINRLKLRENRSCFSFKLYDMIKEDIEKINTKHELELKEETEALKKAKETGKDVVINTIGYYDGDGDKKAEEKFGVECGLITVYKVATKEGKIIIKELASY